MVNIQKSQNVRFLVMFPIMLCKFYMVIVFQRRIVKELKENLNQTQKKLDLSFDHFYWASICCLFILRTKFEKKNIYTRVNIHTDLQTQKLFRRYDFWNILPRKPKIAGSNTAEVNRFPEWKNRRNACHMIMKHIKIPWVPIWLRKIKFRQSAESNNTLNWIIQFKCQNLVVRATIRLCHQQNDPQGIAESVKFCGQIQPI